MLTWLRDKWRRDLVTIRAGREKERRRRRILCPKCGYDVKDLPDQPCPECGLFIRSAWRRDWFGAGSPTRLLLPFMLGWISFSAALRATALLVPGYWLAMDFGIPEAHRTFYLAYGIVLVTWLAVDLAAIAVAIRQRRWMAYGPISEAMRIFLTGMVLVIGCAHIVGLLLQSLPTE